MQSRLYAYMNAQTVGKASDMQQLWEVHAAMNAIHVVAVGQGHVYPYNEPIKTGLLRGVSFGYQNAAR